MKGRIPANSKSLKKTYPNVYKELFSKCSIVTSAPGSFWWTGEHFVLYGSFGINQKIPLRCNVGLESNNLGKIRFQTLKEYIPEKNAFSNYIQDEAVAEKLNLFIQSKIKSKQGIDIHIVSELPLGRGLNASGACSVALTCALQIFNQRLKYTSQNIWAEKRLIELLQKNASFTEVFTEAWKVECIFHGDIASGGTVIGSLASGTYPLVYFPPDLSQIIKKKNDSWKNRYNFIDKLKVEAHRLNELFSLPPYPIWPVDYALIYSGDSRSTASSVMSAISRKTELANTEKEIKKLTQSFSIIVKKAILPESTHNFFKIYLEEIKTISCEILLSLKDIFTKGSSEEILNKLFTFLRRNHELLRFMIPTSDEVNIICKDLSRYKSGYKITGGGGKGDILLCLPYHGIRDEINTLLTKLSKQLNLNVYLDHASWLDNHEEKGLYVEQDLGNNIYSDFVTPGSVKIKSVPSEKLIISDLYSKEKFSSEIGNMDLLLNAQTNKIYIRGKEITSKEIPTSKTAIMVLKKLIENISKEIKNTSFGQGSYFEDRNEFQSKIISPLAKTLQKKLGKSIKIEVHGGIDNFTVKLFPSPFDIYLLERYF